MCQNCTSTCFGLICGSKEDAVLYLQVVDNVPVLNGNALIDQVDPDNREIFRQISLMIILMRIQRIFFKGLENNQETFTFEGHGFRKPSMRLQLEN